MMIVWRIRGYFTAVVRTDTHTHMSSSSKKSVGLSLDLIFAHFLRLAFCVFFWFSLGYFVLVLFAFVMLDLVSSVLVGCVVQSVECWSLAGVLSLSCARPQLMGDHLCG